MSDWAPTETVEASLPGVWNSPFPPEKERMDAPEPTEPKHEFEVEDRRSLDRRRRRAVVIDGLLMLPVYLLLDLAMRGYLGAGLFTAAIALTYHFVMEATTGQTVGKRMMHLRVVMRDGRPAPANAVAARTVFRLIDVLPFAWLVGALCMLLSGGRRQRIGDFAARTIVRSDDRPMPRPPHSPLVAVYPVLWIGMALLAMWQANLLGFHVQVQGHETSNPYMQQVDRICQRRLDTEAALGNSETGHDAGVLYARELGAIDSLPPAPASARHDMRIVRHTTRDFLHTVGRFNSKLAETSDPKVAAAQSRLLKSKLLAMHGKFKQLGLPYCAAGSGRVG
jgi:uncharacterized RDD family membrane protein YckC